MYVVLCGICELYMWLYVELMHNLKIVVQKPHFSVWDCIKIAWDYVVLNRTCGFLFFLMIRYRTILSKPYGAHKNVIFSDNTRGMYKINVLSEKLKLFEKLKYLIYSDLRIVYYS